MAASKLQGRISQHVHKKATKFQRPPMFLESSYPINTVAMLYDQTGENQKWKNQDGGLETSNTYISACTQDSTEISIAIHMFSGSSCPINMMANWQCFTTKREETGSGNSKMAASNFEYLFLSLYTRWQRNSNGYTHVFGVRQHEKTSENSDRRLSMLKIKDGGHYQK